MPDMIGFFGLLKTADGKGYIGAFLVTDVHGKPEEFRVTYPTKPTVVQRHLYGAALEPHIGVSLAALPLYQELKTRHDIGLIVVSSPIYLELASSLACPVVALERVGEQLRALTADTSTPSAKIVSRVGSFAPMSPTFPPRYSEERCREISALIQSYFDTLDLLEPFDRIKLAVGSLMSTDPKFQ